MVSPRLYQWHLLYPEHLPTILPHAGQIASQQDIPWCVEERPHAEWIRLTEVDDRLAHPVHGHTYWMLQGVVYAAAVSLVRQVREEGRCPERVDVLVSSLSP